MKTYHIASLAGGHVVVDNTGEQYGLFGSMHEAQTRLDEVHAYYHKKLEPQKIEKKPEPEKIKYKMHKK